MHNSEERSCFQDNHNLNTPKCWAFWKNGQKKAIIGKKPYEIPSGAGEMLDRKKILWTDHGCFAHPSANTIPTVKLGGDSMDGDKYQEYTIDKTCSNLQEI